MKIALDYDKTYDQDPDFWDTFILLADEYGHEVKIVTARNAELDNIEDKVLEDTEIVYCDGVAKRWFCQHRPPYWIPDIWIDDRVEGILENGPLTEEQIAEWRKNRD